MLMLPALAFLSMFVGALSFHLSLLYIPYLPALQTQSSIHSLLTPQFDPSHGDSRMFDDRLHYKRHNICLHLFFQGTRPMGPLELAGFFIEFIYVGCRNIQWGYTLHFLGV